MASAAEYTNRGTMNRDCVGGSTTALAVRAARLAPRRRFSESSTVEKVTTIGQPACVLHHCRRFEPQVFRDLTHVLRAEVGNADDRTGRCARWPTITR
jgi:hypothetical protein